MKIPHDLTSRLTDTLIRIQDGLRDRIVRHLPPEELTGRAEDMVMRISPFLDSGDSVIDLGCGYGHVYRALVDHVGCRCVPVDVKRFGAVLPEVPVQVYDGKTLDFPDRHFDASLLLTVLHHCDDPRQVFQEALRVSRGKIVVVEDYYRTSLEGWATNFRDSVLNLEIFGHPHNIRTIEAWKEFFAGWPMRIVHLEVFSRRMLGMRCYLVLFVLEILEDNP